MKGKGLTLENIVNAASKLVAEKGYNNFSVRELAQELHVKAASLYNHIDSVDAINREVGKAASAQMNLTMTEAVMEKKRDEAVEAFAYAFRNYVKENYELYRAIIGLPVLDKEDGLKEIGRESVLVVRNIVRQYDIEPELSLHVSRCLRSALHGFVTLEMAGYFTGTSYRAEESFHFLVRGYIEWINHLEKRPGSPPAEEGSLK